jgi:hypothetical protein
MKLEYSKDKGLALIEKERKKERQEQEIEMKENREKKGREIVKVTGDRSIDRQLDRWG